MNGDQTTADTVTVSGVIKWYDPAKGFGFVTPDLPYRDAITTDVLLHKTILNAFGYRDADEAAEISGLAKNTEKGWQITEVLTLAPPAIAGLTEGGQVVAQTEMVVVKWFDTALGYGFVKRPDREEDIFLHAVTVKHAGLDLIEPDQSLNAIICDGPKGKHVKLIAAAA